MPWLTQRGLVIVLNVSVAGFQAVPDSGLKKYSLKVAGLSGVPYGSLDDKRGSKYFSSTLLGLHRVLRGFKEARED